MQSILDFSDDRLERFMAWAHYLHWADLHRRHFDNWMEADRRADGIRADWEFVTLMSAWYTSLWVVVEGWREVPLSDPSVDELLAATPTYLDLLKRYRNGVFHYQPRVIDRRLTDFLSEGEGSVYWVQLLHLEFCRFYWELIERAPLPPALLSELRDDMAGIVDWVPKDIPAARAEAIREKAEQAVSLLRETGDFKSPAARELLEAAQRSTDGATENERRYQTFKAGMIRQIRRRGGRVV